MIMVKLEHSSERGGDRKRAKSLIQWERVNKQYTASYYCISLQLRLTVVKSLCIVSKWTSSECIMSYIFINTEKGYNRATKTTKPLGLKYTERQLWSIYVVNRETTP